MWSKHCFSLANFLVTIHRVLSGKQLGYRLQKDGLLPGLKGISVSLGAKSINSGWRNKFYIRLCTLLLFQARALGTVDISDGRVLVTKRSVDLSQSLVRDVGGPVSLSPKQDADRLSLFHSPPSPRLCVSLPYSPLRSTSPSSSLFLLLLPAASSYCIPRCRFHQLSSARNIKISTIPVVAADPVA